jgi:hypothetical protein
MTPEQIVIALRFWANNRHNGGNKKHREAMPGSVIGEPNIREIYLWGVLDRAAYELEKRIKEPSALAAAKE